MRQPMQEEKQDTSLGLYRHFVAANVKWAQFIKDLK